MTSGLYYFSKSTFKQPLIEIVSRICQQQELTENLNAHTIVYPKL